MLRSALPRITPHIQWAAARFNMPKRKVATQTAAADDVGATADALTPSTRTRRKAATPVKDQATGEAGNEPGASPVSETKRRKSTKAADKQAQGGEKTSAKVKPSTRPIYDESLRPPPPTKPATRLVSWNVAGMRALVKKDPDALTKLIAKEKCDIVCVQEIKVSDKDVEKLEASLQLEGWHAFWNCSTAKAGYSGVATFCKDKPLSISKGIGHELDNEGRVLVTEHPGFWLVNAYTPNSSKDLVRLSLRTEEWDPALSRFCKDLEAKGKPVILTGDLNCARQEIDIHSPKTNLKSAGFTPEERASFQQVYIDQGFVDTFRAQFPDHVGYSYFSHRFNARQKFMGWRLDYFLVSSTLAPRCHDAFLLHDWPGSDHVPLGLVLTDD